MCCVVHTTEAVCNPLCVGLLQLWPSTTVEAADHLLKSTPNPFYCKLQEHKFSGHQIKEAIQSEGRFWPRGYDPEAQDFLNFKQLQCMSDTISIYYCNASNHHAEEITDERVHRFAHTLAVLAN